MLGRSSAPAGDFNGDGFDDFVIGASTRSYVVFGGVAGVSAGISLAAVAGWTLGTFNAAAPTGGFAVDGPGQTVAYAGDIDGDGYDDVIAADAGGDAILISGDNFLAQFDAFTVQNGSSGADILTGHPGVDSMFSYGGADVLLGGAGNDQFHEVSQAVRRVDGGTGFDTVGFTLGDAPLVLAEFAGTRLREIEQINIAGTVANRVVLTKQDVLNISRTSNRLSLAGEPGGRVVFADSGWTRAFVDANGQVWSNGLAEVEFSLDLTPNVMPVALADVGAGIKGFSITGRDGTVLAGLPVAAAGDVNGDGYDDIILGAPLDGMAYVVFGAAGGLGPGIDLSAVAAGTGGFMLRGTAVGDGFGTAVARAGDVNHDGIADLIIGAPSTDGPGGLTDSGASYVVFGATGLGATTVLATSIAAGTGGFVVHRAMFSESGQMVGAAGDINADGIDDVVIGRNGPSFDALVVLGSATGFPAAIGHAALEAGTGGFILRDTTGTASAGRIVGTAGDMNGDGVDDLVLAAPVDGMSSLNFVLFGSAAGLGPVVDTGLLDPAAGFSFRARQLDGDVAAVVAAGDFNGDGYGDIVVGAPNAYDGFAINTGRGAAFVILGSENGFSASIDLADIEASKGGFAITGLTADAHFGAAVAAAGDVDGDGLDDLLISAPGTGDGNSYLVFGRTGVGFGSGVDLAAVASGVGGFRIAPTGPGFVSGLSASAAGDVNGDGFADLVVDEVETTTGAVTSRVIFGGDFEDRVTEGTMRLGDTKDNNLQGTIPGESLVGGDGADILSDGGGSGTLLGGAGNDFLAVTTFGARRLDGGSGFDSLVVFMSGMVLNLTGTPDNRITGIERIDLASGGNLLALSRGDVLHLSDTTNTLEVSGGPGDHIRFDDAGWTLASVAGGEASWVNGLATVKVSTDVGLAAQTVNLENVAAGTGGFAMFGAISGSGFGGAVASAGDVNGDGFADLIVGSSYRPYLTSQAEGSAYVVFGGPAMPATGVALAELQGGIGGFEVAGSQAWARAGWSVASAGDINGDGLDDVVIGVPGDSESRLDLLGVPVDFVNGAAYVVFGPGGAGTSPILLEDLAAGQGGFMLRGRSLLANLGTSVAPAGDFNGDGIDDLILGAPSNPGYDAGAAYVVFGSTAGFGNSVDLDDIAAGIGGAMIAYPDSTAGLGVSVGSAGDVNGDGYGDVVVGAPGAPYDPVNGPMGAAYVVFGRAGGTGPILDASALLPADGFAILGVEPGAGTGMSVSGVGDMNGDGFGDLIVAEMYDRSYVLFGKAGGFGPVVNLLDLSRGIGGFAIQSKPEVFGTYYGSASAAGDVNGDGFDDLIVGSPGKYDPAFAGTGSGVVGRSYVVYGRDILHSVTHPGTSGSDLLAASPGADDLVVGLGNDSISDVGAGDVALGGGGGDTFFVSDLNFALIMGGSGSDQIYLEVPGGILDFGSLPKGRIQEIEGFNLDFGPQTLILSAQDVFNLSISTNNLAIFGDAQDTVDLVGAGWTNTPLGSVGSIHTNGTATVTVSGGVHVACFATGTRIRTTRGEVAVERLSETDRVQTDGGMWRAVRWISHRSLAPRGHPRPWDVQPVRVAASAFGPGLPIYPLRLSPDHTVFHEGVLIPIRYLLNGATMLHAEFARHVWDIRGCALLVTEGPLRDAAHATLLARAAALGHATTTECELHLLADGRAILPVWDGDEASFTVLATAFRLGLASHVMVPAHMNPLSSDTRALGVAVARLAIDGMELALDGAAPGDGWHAAEQGLRWTNGLAGLPCRPGAIVTVKVVPQLRYWLPASPVAAYCSPRSR